MGLLYRSIAGAVLILAVFLLRALLLRRLPKATFRALWMVAAARLLLPFSVPSRFCLYNIMGWTVQDKAFGPDGTAGLVPLPGGAGQTLPEGSFRGITLPEAGYLIGCGLLAVCFLVSYLSWRKKFRVALPVQHREIKEWMGRGKCEGLTVLVSDRIKSPLTYGIFRPVILLPKGMDWEDGVTLGYVLDHEYAHIRHHDALMKLVFAIVLCVHWFNPAVWVMYFMANRDVELYCDEAVLRMGDGRAREPYALALLRMEELKKRPFSLYSHFSGNALEERIVAIMRIRKKTILGAVLAVGIVAGMTTLFATSAFAEGAENEDGQKEPAGTVMVSATPTPMPQELPGTDADTEQDYYIKTGTPAASYECDEIAYVPADAVMDHATLTLMPRELPGTDAGTEQDYYIKTGTTAASYECDEIAYVPAGTP